MAGSVGLPPHFGHRGGRRTAVAAGGGRYNDLVPNDADRLDAVSGNAWLNGIGVQVAPTRPTASVADRRELPEPITTG